MKNNNFIGFIYCYDFIIILMLVHYWVGGRSPRRCWGKKFPETLEYVMRHFWGVGGMFNLISSYKSFFQIMRCTSGHSGSVALQNAKRKSSVTSGI